MYYRISVLSICAIFLGITAFPAILEAQNGLEVGTINPGDVVYFVFQTEVSPNPDVNITGETTTVTIPNGNITYVKGEEYGEYPDATIELSDGGIGFDFVTLKIFSGPSDGFNYTVSIYGKDLPAPLKLKVLTNKDYVL